MKKLVSTLTALTLILTLNAQKQDYFLSNPCLTPDGQTVIFCFEGDLWKADVRDGKADRLTAMEGYETNPRVSPDGKWLAFTGRQSGNADVYILPLEGGAIRQLTWHSGNDEVNSWSWDSKYIYFTSNRYSRMGGYKVSIDGGTPQRVFGDNYFLYDHNLWEDPVTGEIFFGESFESSFFIQRKRYKGPFNPDIQSYNIRTRQYKKYTNWIGKDFGATLDRKGNIYFISDEANGQYNLYTFKSGKKTALTRFSTSIKAPLVNANGNRVVFEKDYQLWVYEVASGKAEKLKISILRNDILPAEKDYQVKGHISDFDVSPDGKKLAFVSRGELFVSDMEGKFIREMDRGSAERVKEVKWLKDNKTLLFSQTLKGYSNWYTMAADGSTKLKNLTADEKNNRNLVTNKDRTKAVYLSGRDEVRLMDLKTLKSETLVKDEIWGFNNSDPGFSPNDEYVYFTAFRNFEQDIFIYNLSTHKATNLTKTGITETGPLWSPDGKYIYFTSQRLEPAYPFGMSDAHVYRLPLEKTDQPFRHTKYDELFREPKKDSTRKDSAGTKKREPISIDTVRIMDRIQQVGPVFGRQALVALLQKDDKTTLITLCNQDQGKQELWKTILEPFEKPKTEKIAGTDGGNSKFLSVKDKSYLLRRGNIYGVNLGGNKTTAVDINFTFRRNLASEFSQMFEEAWAQIQENYYDPNFHGANWVKVKSYYQQFLPYLNNRADLRILLNDMLGELNSSHQGFSSGGAEEAVPLSAQTMETGILFKDDSPYTVSRIVSRSAADHEGIDIKPGDVLVRVNDEKVDPHRNRNAYFTRPSLDGELRLGFTRAGKPFDVILHPQPGLGTNLYDEWIDNNRKRVNRESNNRVAYIYMKNMSQGELENFEVEMTRQFNNKDALILDLRYNTGGNVHDKVLDILSRRSYLKWKYRQGQFTQQPNFAPSDKPIVLLVNEQSLSDAEITSQGFKALKLGTIIGNETYHWIIFTSGVGLVDGSFVRMPAWGCYSLEGKDLEHTGVQPDILVINTFKDKLSGDDPQLDRAVEEILKKIKN